jgi:hypothetical protein
MISFSRIAPKSSRISREAQGQNIQDNAPLMIDGVRNAVCSPDWMDNGILFFMFFHPTRFWGREFPETLSDVQDMPVLPMFVWHNEK